MILDSLVSKGYSLGIVRMDDELSIDSTTVPAKRGRQVGFNGHRHIKGAKIHAVTNDEGIPSHSHRDPSCEPARRKEAYPSHGVDQRQAREGKAEEGGGGRRSSTRTPSTTCRSTSSTYLDHKHVKSQMPDTPGKKKRAGRQRAFDKKAYNRIRSMIERFDGWIKAFRRVAETRS
jgi:hypothetical protein